MTRYLILPRLLLIGMALLCLYRLFFPFELQIAAYHFPLWMSAAEYLVWGLGAACLLRHE